MMIKIRFALPDDAAELMAMNGEANGVNDLDAAAVRAELESGRELVAVAAAGKALAGYCCVQYYKSFCHNDAKAELTELYVRPEFRHKGLASRMIACQSAELKKRGVAELEVKTEADDANANAVYSANGFSAQGRLCLARRL